MTIEYVKALAVCANGLCFTTEDPGVALSGSIEWRIVYHFMKIIKI